MYKGTAEKIIKSDSLTGYGFTETCQTSKPDSLANKIMYGYYISEQPMLMKIVKPTGVYKEDFCLTERDFELLKNKILNTSLPNAKLVELFDKYTIDNV
jgi:hypothetical protein